MKKLLALVLALVMTLGLATVGANAALSDYKDADSIEYDEAVAVLQAIKVMVGDPDGSFRPGDKLSRAEAAKIIAYLRLGNETAEKVLVASGNKFSDVPASHWGAKYVEYCASEGIINGIGDGKFSPDGTLLTIDFAKMLLGALGYDANVEGMTGADYRINTSKLANQVGLFDGKDNVVATSECTRDEAALYAFNTIKTPLVQYANKGSSISVNGAEVAFGASNWDYMTTTAQGARYRAIADNIANGNNEAQIVEFAENYYPGLTVADSEDVFGRPANKWTYNNTTIGTFVNKYLLVDSYTTGITGKTLYDLLGENAIKNSVITYKVDGAEEEVIKASNMIRTNVVPYYTTGNGVLTEVYQKTNANNNEIIIVSIDTFLATADDDFNADTGKLSLTVYDGVNLGDGAWAYRVADGNGYEVNVTDVAAAASVKADDVLQVQRAWVNDAWAVVNLAPVKETKEDVTLTEYSTSPRNEYVTIKGGDKLSWNWNVSLVDTGLNTYANSALSDTYVLYLDSYGNLLGARAVEAELNYVFLVGYNGLTSSIAMTTVDGLVIFPDGTAETVKVNTSRTNSAIKSYNDLVNYPAIAAQQNQYNRWFSYTESKGVYTLKPVKNWNVATATDKTNTLNINAARPLVDGVKGSDPKAIYKSYGNDDSVYITVDATEVSAGPATHTDSKFYGLGDVTGVYTGVQKIDLRPYNTTDDTDDLKSMDETIFTVYDDNRYIIAAVVFGEDQATTTNYVFATDVAAKEYVKDGSYYWDFDGIVDGEKKTLTIKGEYANVIDDAQKIKDGVGINDHPAMYLLTYDADGYVIDVELITDVAGDKYFTNQEHSDLGASIKSMDTYKVFDVYTYEDSTVYRTGRTLWAYDDEFGTTVGLTYGGEDIGLTVDEKAPIFVIEYLENSNGVVIGKTVNKYTALAQALNALRDSDAATDGKQFTGEIGAVLNTSTGNAKWVVIKSATARPVTTDNGSTGAVDTEVGEVFVAADGKISVYNKSGKLLTSWRGLTFEVYSRAPGANTFQADSTGKLGKATGETDARYTAFDNGTTTVDTLRVTAVDSGHGYYVVIGGVESNHRVKP